jgi:hypothetical protein
MIKNRYTFTLTRVDEENYDEESRIEMTNNDLIYLPDVIKEFEHFLRGCGFYFDGSLEIVGDKDRD